MEKERKNSCDKNVKKRFLRVGEKLRARHFLNNRNRRYASAGRELRQIAIRRFPNNSAAFYFRRAKIEARYIIPSFLPIPKLLFQKLSIRSVEYSKYCPTIHRYDTRVYHNNNNIVIYISHYFFRIFIQIFQNFDLFNLVRNFFVGYYIIGYKFS